MSVERKLLRRNLEVRGCWLNLLDRILAEGRQGVVVSPRRVVEDEGFDQILKMIRF